MFSKEEINATLKIDHQCGQITKTIRILGYLTRRTMYQWIENEEKNFSREEISIFNTAKHLRNLAVDVKMDAIHCCFELGKV